MLKCALLVTATAGQTHNETKILNTIVTLQILRDVDADVYVAVTHKNSKFDNK